VLVEHPLEAGWTLVKPEAPQEKTRDRSRFAVAAEPGKTATLEVVEEMPLEETHAITNLDDDRILFYSRVNATSPAVRESLAEVIRRKRDLEQLARDRQIREQALATIDQEQARIRGNMGTIDRGSDLFNQYVKKLTGQEQRIETLRDEIAALQEREQEARKGLDAYLLALDVK
jgi:chromosome segregation ATPase